MGGGRKEEERTKGWENRPFPKGVGQARGAAVHRRVHLVRLADALGRWGHGEEVWCFYRYDSSGNSGRGEGGKM